MSMSVERGANRGDRSRQAILAAAREIFASQGYRGASLASIAASVDMTQPGVLHHYPSKERLLLAILNEHYHADGALISEAIVRGGADLLDALCALMQQNGQDRMAVQFFSVLVAESIAEDHPAHDYVTNRYTRVRERLVDSLAAGKSRGEVSPDLDTEAVVNLLIAAMDGLQTQWLLDDKVQMGPSMRLLVELVRNHLATGMPAEAVAHEGRDLPH